MNRIFRLAFVSLIFNMAFAAYHVIFGVLTESWWLLTAGVYYAILSVLRFYVILARSQNGVIIRFVGAMLMLLTLPLVGTVVLAVERNRGHLVHEILMIGMAVYSFTKITLAIINMIKLRRSTSDKLVALRSISFADACVSIFSLQRSMLTTFGNMSEVSIRIFNAALGSAVCIVVFLLGLNLVRSKKMLYSTLNK